MPTAAQMADNLANAMRQAVVSLITADGVVEDEEKTVGLEVMQRYPDTVYARADLEEDIKHRSSSGAHPAEGNAVWQDRTPACIVGEQS